MRKFYVYEYRHPVTKVPFYVGKGAGSRWKQHLTGRTHNQHLSGEIENLRREGLVPEVDFPVKDVTEATALQVEEHLISSYGRRIDGGLLCNIASKCRTNIHVNLPQECVDLLGTVTDKELSEVFEINASTIKTKRQELGVTSHKHNDKRDKSVPLFIKDKSVHVLYNSNGESITGTRRLLSDTIGCHPSEVGSVVNGTSSHVRNWYSSEDKARNANDVSTVVTFIHTGGSRFTGTYLDFSQHTGIRKRSCSNLIKGYCLSLHGWVIEGRSNTVHKKRDENNYVFVRKDGSDRFEGLRVEFEEYSGLTSGDISNLVRGRQRTSKGWLIQEVVDGT